MQHADRIFVSGDLLSTILDCLDGAVSVGLDEDCELLRFATVDLVEHCFQRAAARNRGTLVAGTALAELGEFTGSRFVLNDSEFVTSGWRSTEADDFRRR